MIGIQIRIIGDKRCSVLISRCIVCMVGEIIIIAVVVVFILISLIMKYSMSKINKQNTIETIRNENI